MSQLSKQKIAVIVGIVAAIAIGAYFIPLQKSVAIEPIVEDKTSEKIGADVFDVQRDKAISIAKEFAINSPTFAFDGMQDTLMADFISVMESYPEQYRINVSFTSAHAGFGDRTDQVVAQVITPHIMDIIVSDGKVISAVTDGLWDELNHQYVLKQTTPVKATSYDSLIDELINKGIIVEVVEVIPDSSFAVPTNVISVNGEDVQVFEFSSENEAQVASEIVSKDGTEIGTSIIRWIAPPHFYTNGNIIVLYVGDNLEMTVLLSELLGPQFAGM